MDSSVSQKQLYQSTTRRRRWEGEGEGRRMLLMMIDKEKEKEVELELEFFGSSDVDDEDDVDDKGKGEGILHYLIRGEEEVDTDDTDDTDVDLFFGFHHPSSSSCCCPGISYSLPLSLAVQGDGLDLHQDLAAIAGMGRVEGTARREEEGWECVPELPKKVRLLPASQQLSNFQGMTGLLPPETLKGIGKKVDKGEEDDLPLLPKKLLVKSTIPFPSLDIYPTQEDSTSAYFVRSVKEINLQEEEEELPTFIFPPPFERSQDFLIPHHHSSEMVMISSQLERKERSHLWTSLIFLFLSLHVLLLFHIGGVHFGKAGRSGEEEEGGIMLGWLGLRLLLGVATLPYLATLVRGVGFLALTFIYF